MLAPVGMAMALIVTAASIYSFSPRQVPPLQETRIPVNDMQLTSIGRSQAGLVMAGELGAILVSADEGRSWNPAAVSNDRQALITRLVFADERQLDGILATYPRDGKVVIYCACPDEVSAAWMAARLREAGFRDVLPLRGGIDAWRDAGYGVERIGGWKEWLPIIQDARFLQDAGLVGGRFAYAPGIGARYRMHRGASLSRRSSSAFVVDVFRNACDLQATFEARGRIDAEQRVQVAEQRQHAELHQQLDDQEDAADA